MISIPCYFLLCQVHDVIRPYKTAGDARYASQDPIRSLIDCSIQYRLQSVLGVRSLFVESNNIPDLETALVVTLTNRNVIVI